MSMVVSLGNVCSVLNGFAFQSKKYVSSGVRVIRITNVQDGYIEDLEPAFYPVNVVDLSKYFLQAGDLLISLTGNVGRVGLLGSDFLPAALNQRVGCIRVKPSEQFLIKYVYYHLRSKKFLRECLRYANGVAQKNLSTEWLKKYELQAKSRKEQQHIVSTLDSVQSLLTHYKQQLELLDTLVRARFVEMFEPYIMDQSNHILLLNLLSQRPMNGYFAKRDEYIPGGNVSILGVANVVNRMYSNISNLPTTNAKESDIKKYSVEYGDILFCRSSLVAEGIGKASIVPSNIRKDILFECHVIRLKLDLCKCVPEYLQVLTTTDFFRVQILRYAKTAIMTTIGQEGIVNTFVPVPPLSLQNQFASFVQQVEKTKADVRKGQERAQMLFDSLMQEYFG